MIGKLIELSARNRLIVFIITGLVLIWSVWTIRKTPLDALPDLSDVQVIIFTEWMGRSPNLIEDQITYPIVTTFLGAPKVKLVRGFTMFGMSFVSVIFQDGTDLYWARSRTLEYLSKIQGQLPEGVTPIIGPDATGVGWVFEYALIDESGKYNLQDLRTFQDWYLRYWLQSVPGVAEVASVGGYQKEYQVEIDPTKLQAFDLSIADINEAIRLSNEDVGGRVIELAEHEYAVRGRGYITNKEMLEQVVVGTDQKGTPILIRDIGRVQIGGNIRRGLVELNGEGEVAGGIVVMRFGEDTAKVIDRVKEKIKEMEPSFPPGIKLVTTYDRSTLIKHSVDTLSEALIEEIIIVSLVILIFLFHFRSTLVSIITLPIAIMISFIPMYYMGINANIMSLAGIIIAIGDIVDSAVIMTENAHKKLEQEGEKRSRIDIVTEAAREIGPSIFASLFVIVIGFLPVFVLQEQEGRLFSPLAYTKTFSVVFGALLGVTLVPALMVTFIRGKIRPEMKNPITRLSIAAYKPVLRFCVRFRYFVVGGCLILILGTIPIYYKLGSEFMPPLDEETILFMPITTPGISIEAVKNLVQTQDKILRKFPEVQSVFGKAGRSETPTDPAPISMIETVITLKPKSEWRSGMTKNKLLEEMNQALQFAGVQNAFTMPIKARIDMLTTGIRTPIGIKIFGKNLSEIEMLGEELEKILKNVPGTRSVYAERIMGGFFIDFIPDREALARYGLTIMDVNNIVETAIGGIDVNTTTIEGRERYKINVRYPRELRSDIDKLRHVLVPIKMKSEAMGRVQHVPLGQLGKIEAVMDSPMIFDEMGSLSGWVYIDIEGRDIGGYVKDAKKAVAQNLKLPTGYYLKWTGQYEYLERIQALMKVVVPLTLIIIAIVLYLNFRGIAQTLIVMLSVPFAAVGAIWLLFSVSYNTSVAVWVGMIALLGTAAETTAIMVVYLDEGFKKWTEQGRINSQEDLLTMTVEHGASRVRPLIMAVALNIFGLLPIIWSGGVGSDIAKRIAAPLWGGLISLTLLTLLVVPAIYVIWRSIQFRHIKPASKDAS
ncbi:MAG: CusA/CzcA family heavy metal efflux RND transporter [Chlamydiales bacterium]|nr:CusA/CzcA family heavy metal efflux RND transporter [Chlamydiales bacterium]